MLEDPGFVWLVLFSLLTYPTCHPDFSRYNPFIMHQDIYCVYIYNKRNVCRKARITSILNKFVVQINVFYFSLQTNRLKIYPRCPHCPGSS